MKDFKITDEEIDKAFQNTNFGDLINRRKYLAYSLLKIASGWHCGGTITQVLQELKLVGKRIDLPTLTKNGKRYMWDTLAIGETWTWEASHE
jgi:hypothetical protein